MTYFRRDRFRRRSVLGQFLIVAGLTAIGFNDSLGALILRIFHNPPEHLPFASGVVAIVAGLLMLISTKHTRNIERSRENREFNHEYSELGVGALTDAPLVLFLRSRENAEGVAIKKYRDAQSRQRLVRQMPSRSASVMYAVVALLFIVGATQMAEFAYAAAALVISAVWTFSLFHRLTDSVDHRGDSEEEISGALLGRAHLIAIGDDTPRTRDAEIRAALKLTRHDINWKVSFFDLSSRADLILVEVGNTDAVLWEIKQIAGRPDLINKTLAVLPPEGSQSQWTAFTSTSGEANSLWPTYNSRGLVCSLPELGKPSIAVPYKSFLAGLREVAFDRNQGVATQAVRGRVIDAALRDAHVSELRSKVREG